MKLNAFRVVPALPERLAGLREIAYNLRWSWDDDLRTVFSRLDRDLWDRTYQNPVLLLGSVSQERLEALAGDDSYLALYDRALERLRSYLTEPTAWDRRWPDRPLVAYFSAEYGIAECLPIYSGGLGVLSGHHLKSASDLGVPLVAVGLLYQQGYFRQYLSSDGWQQESYPVNDFYNVPVQLASRPDGTPLRLELDLAGRRLVVQVWRADVGRVPLFLLDTNVPENPPDLRDITDQLYGGDQETRIEQEIVLGIGGLRALRALGREPVVCHMNEGHSAFLALERIRVLMRDHGLTFREGLEAVRAGSIFTTHTPVPAGFDVFRPELMDRYFGAYLREVGISRADLLALGRPDGADNGAGFNMAALALRTSEFANGVSELHGEISRRLLGAYFPGLPEHEVPIGHVTNGAHARSCVSREMAGLFDRYLGPDWTRRPAQEEVWAGVDAIPDEELWATHERRRERLVAFARRRLARQLEQRGASARDVERARGVLNTRALTIGFARRFATYKRADLILRDLDRLEAILLPADRPVQVIFAGKAHPADREGKEILKAVVGFCQRDKFRRHAVFIEDYDLVVARYLVQGVDVWLNTPRRGMEASGTSGMKVVPNGGLNLSILDGWWCEGYRSEAGWAIGKGEEYEDHNYQDAVESGALYDLLQQDVVPLFYTREADGLPRGWIQRMKRSMKLLSPAFSTHRMLWEYSERYYVPAAHCWERRSAEGMAKARELAAWKDSLRRGWGAVEVESVEEARSTAHRVGEGFAVTAVVRVGSMDPRDVAVEAYFGSLSATREVRRGQAVRLELVGSLPDGRHRYAGSIPCDRSGMQGYSVRVRPSHPEACDRVGGGPVAWWEG
ncbi:MAG TPA: alpha-glucan family phosphorylase [Vicinamibacteria bacterium]|nr:alpha-glucan family phosphorylase [Vicinamibacteria bacterium]